MHTPLMRSHGVALSISLIALVLQLVWVQNGLATLLLGLTVLAWLLTAARAWRQTHRPPVPAADHMVADSQPSSQDEFNLPALEDESAAAAEASSAGVIPSVSR